MSRSYNNMTIAPGAVTSVVSIVPVLDQYRLTKKMSKSGNMLYGLNPFDPWSTNRSRFQVDIEKNCWVLTGSDKAGDAVALVAEMESISRDQAAQLIREWFKVPAPTGMAAER